MATRSARPARHTSRGAKHRRLHVQISGSGSGSGIPLPCAKFFPKGYLLPADLRLHLDGPLQGGSDSGRQQLNRPAVLIHAEDPGFACCWFSRAIDLGDESGNPAFWILEKTGLDTWSLCLRRVSGQLAAYHLKSKIKRFPIKLNKGRVTKDFRWPPTITISQGA